jgi:hypothetical protein
MSISVITNFKVNAYTPIDSRLVATNSAALNEIQYPYEGLTVFTKDRNLNYTYNGSVWQVSSNGIYGGSGSMVGSTDVNMGQVGGVTNDRAFELVLSASSSTSPDRAQYATSFIRNNTGVDYDTVEVRNQVRYIDNGTVLNGPYISFNKNDSKKGIISLGTPDRNFVTTVERFRIEPDSAARHNGAIILTPSTYSPPLTVGQNVRYGTFIGYNFDGRNKNLNGTASSMVSFGGGRISFQSLSVGLNTLNDSILTPTEILRIGSVDGNLLSDEDFFQVNADTTPSTTVSPTFTGANVARDFLTIPQIITNLEHRFIKTQHLGWNKTLAYETRDGETSVKQYLLDNGVILLSPSGNFFDFELAVDTSVLTPQIRDIQFFRLGNDEVYFDAPPAGTSITIRFTYERSPIIGGQNFSSQILLWQNSNHNTRKIRSSYADINGGETIIVRHNLGSTDIQDRNESVTGDIITFMRGGDGYWYITNIQREKELIKKLSSETLVWYKITTTNTVISTWQPYVLVINTTNSTYVWSLVNWEIRYTLESSHAHPHKYPFTTTPTTTTSGLPNTIPLMVAKDTSGKVFMRGSFRLRSIVAGELTKLWNVGAQNQVIIGRILDASYTPPDLTPTNDNTYAAWGYCEITFQNTSQNTLPYGINNATTIVGGFQVQGRIYVDYQGYIILQFPMMDFSTVSTLPSVIQVNVPEFSYRTT